MFMLIAPLVLSGCALFRPAPDGSQAGPEEAKRIVVARVNGAPVSMAALVGMMNRIGGPQGAAAEPAGERVKKALDRLIFQELAYQRAGAAGVAVDPGTVDNAMANFRENVGGEQAFRDYLSKEGVTEQELRANAERGLVLELIYAREVLDKTTVPEDELNREYEQAKARYVAPEKIRIVDVFFLDRRDKRTPQRKANAVLKSIRSDKDKNPWNLLLDGSFIVRNLDNLKGRHDELRDAAKQLAVNGVSGVIKAPDGLHIIKLIEYAPERQLSLDEVRSSLEGGLRVRAQEKRLEEWKQELRSLARVEIFEAAISERGAGEAGAPSPGK
jgi:parvulin-like peptidyl-prolyl isomerase